MQMNLTGSYHLTPLDWQTLEWLTSEEENSPTLLVEIETVMAIQESILAFTYYNE